MHGKPYAYGFPEESATGTPSGLPVGAVRANLMFMSMFVLTEDEFMEHVNKVVDKYPDLESYLLG